MYYRDPLAAAAYGDQAMHQYWWGPHVSASCTGETSGYSEVSPGHPHAHSEVFPGHPHAHLGRREVGGRDRHLLGKEEFEERVVENVDVALCVGLLRGRLKRLDGIHDLDVGAYSAKTQTNRRVGLAFLGRILCYRLAPERIVLEAR